MLKFEELEVFVRIVEAQGIGKAAEQLGITKSMTSRRLADLEQRLAVKLFNRSTRKLSLTDEGQDCYQRALNILDSLNELEMSANQGRQQIKGNLRIAIPLDFGLQHLSPAIDQFSQQYPDITFDIDISNSLVDLLAEGTDVAIRIGLELPDSSLKARLLTRVRGVLVASPEYIEQHPAILSPEDIQSHPYIQYRAHSPDIIPLIDRKGHTSHVGITTAMTTNNGLFANEMLKRGRGISLMPEFICQQSIEDGSLTRLLPDYVSPEGYIHAVYPATRFLPLRVRCFIDFLVAYFSSES